MPQMYPMNWFFLLIMFSMSLFLIMLMINSFMLYPFHPTLNIKNLIPPLWKW